MAKGLSRIKLWSVGGGKGGIGKSLVTMGLGMALARLRKKVILIDSDLGGANLHTLMGIRYPEVTLEHFLSKRVSRLEDVIIDTSIPDLSLICGADDILGAANPTYAQKIRLLHQMEELPAQYVLLDLGAGTSFNLLDLFNYSPGKIALFTSQATSLQNVYGFIKSALYRKLSREFAKDDEVLNLLYQSGNGDAEIATQSIRDLMANFKRTDPQKTGQLSRVLWDFNLFLVVNMVKSASDLKATEIIRSVCQDFLCIQPEILGAVSYDLAMEAVANQMVPSYLEQKKSKAAAGLEQIALKLVKESRLPKSAWQLEPPDQEATEMAVKPLATHPSYTSGS